MFSEAKKVKLEKIENISEFSLTFLRPAPPKMSIRPSQIRQHLFPSYKSVPPPVDDANLLNKPSVTPRRIQLSSTKSKSVIRSTPKNEKFNLIDELDEFDEKESKINLNDENNLDEDTFDDSELEFQFVIERILNRNYSSETDLRKLKWDESGQEESSTSFKKSKEDPIFAKEPQLFRTLSDSLLTRRKTSKKIKSLRALQKETKRPTLLNQQSLREKLLKSPRSIRNRSKINVFNRRNSKKAKKPKNYHWPMNILTSRQKVQLQNESKTKAKFE